MSEHAGNPYSELVAEHEGLVDELIAKQFPAVRKAELVLEACEEFQQKFEDLLKSRRASICPDFEALYQMMDELDRKLSVP